MEHIAQPATAGGDRQSASTGRMTTAALSYAVFAVSLAYAALLPVLPGWLASIDRSIPVAGVAQQVGELSGIYMLGVFLGALMAGSLSDGLGRRAVLTAALLAFLLAQFAAVHANSLRSLYILRLVAGAASGAVVPVASAMLLERSGPADGARRLAILGAASLLGFLAGPMLVSLAGWSALTVYYDPRDVRSLFALTIHVTVVLAAVALPLVWYALKTGTARMALVQRERIRADPGAYFRLAWLLALNFAVLLALGGFEVAVSLFGRETLNLRPERVALMFAECSVVMLVVNAALFLFPWSRHVPIRLVLAASLLAMATGFMLLYLTQSYGVVVFAIALIAGGAGIAMPLITWTAGRGVRRDSTIGRLVAAGSLGQAMGSAAGGWMFALAASQTFLVGAVFMALTIFLGWIAIRGAPAVDNAPTGRRQRDSTQL